jgi:FAD/FMN-containing dehydrogenase
MARKPVNTLRRGESRDAIWAAIRQLSEFTVRDIWLETQLSKASIQDYLQGLSAAGYLRVAGTRTADYGSRAHVYQLMRDVGIEAPRVRRDGTEVTQGRGREQMWRTMRILGEFSSRDLAVNASTETCVIAEKEAKDYCYYLHLAGYLAVSRPGKGTGKGGVLTRYRFLAARYSGPKPPMIQRIKAVYDPNRSEVVWSSLEVKHDDK